MIDHKEESELAIHFELDDRVAVITIDRPEVQARLGLIDRVYPREAFEDSWRALARRIASSPARPIKSVIAQAAPHHHPAHEQSAAAAFATLWTSDAHWAAVEGTRAPG